ncbi:TetR/AcrR family transcriptional regulator [Vallitalea pronyensis]|uniref:TetR/AcrR family transcriptional regulator n=1 Tax=Vallitalea pronyensis TaxID=1348613 RepID=A0A8J8MKI8_9FIRM|nr:TetR/AcrR family transcriptional regulator [Vallitalea pronyensis]QUI23179.1 TetR/AcrR family transcriptional regulator [Vallitalea pronyensis]
MDKAEQRSLNKRSKILDSAIGLFLTHTVKKVTMDDIARQAHVSKVTIYKYFGDKESFYASIGETIFDRFYSRIENHHHEKETLTQRMINCTHVLIDFITSQNLSLCLALSQLNEQVKKEHEMFNAKIRKILISQIKEGKTLKLVRSDLSDDVIYHYIDMGLNYFQCNLEYRHKITTDLTFSKAFMTFIWSNIFMDYSDFQVNGSYE